MEKIGLVIPVYNRSEYLEECIRSLSACNFPSNIMIVFMDDASTDGNVSKFIADFISRFPGLNIKYVINNHNIAIGANLIKGIEYCLDEKCEVIINLDSDAIVKKNFIDVLLQLKKAHPNYIVSGFNCIKEDNPFLRIENNGSSYGLKKFCNGLNMCFDSALYRNYIKPSIQLQGNWDYNTSILCQKNNLPFVISIPSVVQHIGFYSSMGNYPPDYADDFKQLVLPDVTLFGVDAHNPQGLIKAAKLSQIHIGFGATQIITERLFNGREGYSEFCIKKLGKYINTSHVLVIHPDGYVINWKAWENDFLNFDYIGATWSYKDNMNVGNGGFSLRSKKLCDILMKDDFINDFHPEDDRICRKYRPYLEKNYGIKFAPEEVANRFSIEAYGANAFKDGNLYNGQFGFHSVFVDFSKSSVPQFLRYVRPVAVRR